MLVVDASVAVKWVFQEADTVLADALVGADALGAPELVLAEVANVAWKKQARGLATPAQASRAVDDLPSFFDHLYGLQALMRRAASIAQSLAHPVYDCVYLALAERERAEVVTADKRLLARVAGTPWAAHVRDLATFAPTS